MTREEKNESKKKRKNYESEHILNLVKVAKSVPFPVLENIWRSFNNSLTTQSEILEDNQLFRLRSS